MSLAARILLRVAANARVKRVHDAADRHRDEFRRLVEAAFMMAKNAINVPHLMAALRSRDPQSVEIVLDPVLTVLGNWLRTHTEPVLRRTFNAGAAAARENLRGLTLPRLASMRIAAFDPDQPRDEQGQWTAGGGGTPSGSDPVAIAEQRIDDAIKSTTYEQDDETGGWYYSIESESIDSYDLDEEGFNSKADAEAAADRVAQSLGENDPEFSSDTPVTEVYLSIKNPKRVSDQADDWKADVKKAKEEGYDGIVYRNQFEDKGKDSWIAFSPEQIKSVKARKFDRKSKLITQQRFAAEIGGFAFDVNNPRALRWAREHAAELVSEVTDATRSQIRDLVASAFEEQFDVTELAEEIEAVIGDAARADTIAATEVIRASNEGQQELWSQAVEEGLLTGKEQKEWIVTPDDRLCPICEPMEGVTVALDETFNVEGDQIDGPPAHPRCLPAGIRITSASRILATTERTYQGEIVVLRTTGGQELTCTPNHPVLTPTGWVAAGLLQKGGYVLCYLTLEGVPSNIDFDDQHVPAMIEEIAEAFRVSEKMAAHRVPTSAEDFHGDGREGQVAIVRTNRMLRQRGQIDLLQPSSELMLVVRGMQHQAFTGQGALSLLSEGMSPDSSGGMGRAGLPETSLGRHQGPFHHRGIMESPRGDTIIDQTSGNRPSADPVSERELIDRLASQVTPDKIVSIRRVPFQGHVYNLQTESGWYGANGIVTHNCRCTVGLSLET